MRRLRSSVVLLLCAACLLPHTESRSTERQPEWRAGTGYLTLEIRGDYLPDFGIEVRHDGRPITDREILHFKLEPIEPIGIHAPWGIFKSLAQESGQLRTEAQLEFRRGNDRLVIDKLDLVPGERSGHPLLFALDEQGRRLFALTHMHLTIRPDTRTLSVTNTEVEASAHLARSLGFEEFSGLPIGTGRLELALTATDRTALSGTPTGCAERPIWPQQGLHEADVALINMDNVAYQGTHSDGRIKIAPSAALRNESLADIPWVPQFDSLDSYPYSPPDQHPFLVWGLYRISDGRIEMLAASGAKHAFNTINVNCTSCGSNNVLWAGCEDIYSSGSNDTSTYQGPRNEIIASEGLWYSCNSFFDPGCSNSQTQYSGQWQHRLLVDPDELEQPGAAYFIDAWYIVQHDVNIWNTMGYRPIAPEQSESTGSGWIMNPGPFREGPAISEWVAADENETLADHDLVTIPSATPNAPYPDNMPQGHLRLLVRVTEVETGHYRYNYALQNYDFDRALEGFQVALADGAVVFDHRFGDIDEDSANDWQFERGADHVRFDAPPDNPLNWFTLFNFEIETDAPPVSSQVAISLGEDAVKPAANVVTIGPAETMNLIFRDRFDPPGS